MLQYHQIISHLLHTRHIENCDSVCKERNVHFCLASYNKPHAFPHINAEVAELRMQAGVTPMNDIALKITISIRAFIDSHMQEISLLSKSFSLAFFYVDREKFTALCVVY